MPAAREAGEPQRRLRLAAASSQARASAGDRCRRTTERRYRPATGRDRPRRRFVERADLDARDVHGRPQAPSAAATAPRSTPFSPITTSRPAPRLAGAPRPVELAAEARADALHQQPHRLAGDVEEALHAQHVMRPAIASARRSTKRVGIARSPGTSTTKVSKSSWSCSSSASWCEGRGARSSSAAAARRAAHRASIAPFARRDDLHRARQAPAISARNRVELGRRDKIGLVEHDDVGAQQLVLVDFLERIVVVERRVRGALRGDRFAGSSAKRPSATAAASTTAMTPSTVSLARSSGQSNALTSGFGNARPEVSMMMCSGWARARAAPRSPERNRRRRCSRCSRWPVRRCSPAGRRSSPQRFRISPSTPTSPNSLMISARRRPSAAPAHGGSASSCRRRESR